VRPRHDDPEIPERIEAKDLDRSARAELKTLTKENADWVARHLVAAAEALEDDPALAHRHALSASRRAGRIAVVRETLAITAYATGDFALALREFRTFRRISGSDEQLPLMVDSERGVGRPDRALELGRSVDRSTLPASVQVALAIAMSGARLDLGQPELALAELEIPQLDPDRAFSYSPALFSAYAEVLEELGRSGESASWRERAQRAEAALAGDGLDLVEVYEVEGDDAVEDAPVDESGAMAAAEEPAESAEEPVEAVSTEGGSESAGDPADAIEPEVAEILAETAGLDAADESGDETESERA
jgi:23S rRNA pseudouridine2605 synthase